MTILESLRSLSGYPIPTATIENITEAQSLYMLDEATPGVRQSTEYRKAEAFVYLFLSDAPNVSQGGVSYSFSEEERRRFRNRATGILSEVTSYHSNSFVNYGHKGEDL